MAYKMKGFSYPGASPMKQTHDKNKGLKTNQNNKLDEVSVSGKSESTNTNNRLPMYLPGGGDYDPITATATNTNADKRQSSREKFNSDVSSFISGIAGIPERIVEDITGKVSDVGGLVKKGVDKRKANRLARKQDKINNPKPEKVKKVKVKKVKKVKVKKVKKVKEDKTTDRTKSLQAEYQSEHKDGTKFPDGKTYNAKGKKVMSKETKDNIKKSWKGAKSQIGEQLITQGVSTGIQALLTPKEKEQRDRSNPNLSGFSQMKFGRRKMKE
jgi:hypothetical protein